MKGFMMKKMLKRIVATLSPMWQNDLKRMHYRRQIRRGTFGISDPEYAILPRIIAAGDWVIDVGANVGHYTNRFSEIVGEKGRVIAFEPVLETLSLLAANLQVLSRNNVTLINVALSDKTTIVGIDIPAYDNGLRNFYQARMSSLMDSDIHVLTLALDSLNISNKIALIKIDAEGHEDSVLKGMHTILLRDKPTLIVETRSRKVQERMENIGYITQRLDGSPNVLFRDREKKYKFF